jgi:hypothetical protein
MGRNIIITFRRFMLGRVRAPLPLVLVLLAGCGTPPPPLPQAADSTTTEAWYGPAVDELAGLNQQTRKLMRDGKSDQAAALIVKGEALSQRLISVPHPTLAATIAASDLDELYGQMLFSNGNYGWARLMFQKNLARWKYWKPPTPETEAKRKEAEAAIAECDRRISPVP